MNTFHRTAIAEIRGGADAPDLCGTVRFYQKRDCVLVTAQISNLPRSSDSGFFGFHIHEGDNCSGEAFANTKNHYNPWGEEHPRHMGDMPPLMLCRGGAYLSFTTDRFRVEEIIGRTVVIHSGPDDFTSQPGGNSGKKIACGVIRRG